MEVTFLEDMEMMEKFYTTRHKAPALSELLVPALNFSKAGDFAQIPRLLQKAFEHTLGALDFTNVRGYIIITKKAVKLVIRKAPTGLKERFNRGAFYLNNRRVFLV